MASSVRVVFSALVGSLACAPLWANLPELELAPRVIAEEVEQSSYPNSNAIALRVGEASLYPSLGLRLTSIDNVFFSADDADATDSGQVSLAPRADYIASGAKQMLWFGYLGSYAQHADAEAADFDDHRFSVVSHTAFDSRKRLDLEGSLSISHQDLGTARTADFTAAELSAVEEVDQFRQSKAGGAFSYGNPATKGELVVGYAAGSIDFTSNEDQTRQYDRDFSVLWSRLYYRLSPDTRIFGSVAQRSLDYDVAFVDDGIQRDSTSTTLSTGFLWDISGLWYGSASVGSRRWDYDSAALTDTDVVIGDIGLTWLVKSYSRVLFSYNRREFESLRGNDLAESTTTGVQWAHEWSDRLSTRISFSSVSEEENDASLDTDYSTSRVEVRFAPRRWVRLLAGYSANRVDKLAGDASRATAYFGAEANF